MFDENICLVCGRQVASAAAYCSRECSIADSSSSSYSAPSSSHPSPQVLPADRAVDPAPLPSLVYSHRNRPSLSSTSTVDSDEFVYGPDPANINYTRRPSATNNRRTVPTLHANPPSSHRRLSSNTSDVPYMRFRDEDPLSSFAKTQAWKDNISQTNPSLPDSSLILDPSRLSSDDEFSFDDPYVDFHQETIKKRTSLKHLHRVSLPSYFSRLSVGPTARHTSPRTPQSPNLADQPRSYPSTKLSKSPRSRSSYGPSISTSTTTITGTFKGFTPTTAEPSIDPIPRGRGRERRAHVRQGASRSPKRHFSRSISPLEFSSSPVHPVAIPLVSNNGVSNTAGTKQVTAPRGRDPIPRALNGGPVTSIPKCGSLGGRILREAQPQPPSNVEDDQPPNRGRKSREEAKERDAGEERERGRSRLVVRRAAASAHAV